MQWVPLVAKFECKCKSFQQELFGKMLTSPLPIIRPPSSRAIRIHVSPNSSIWCRSRWSETNMNARPLSNTNHLSSYSSLFSNYYNKPGNTNASLQDPAIGDFCVARFSEDNYWYRARVVLKRGKNSLKARWTWRIFPLIDDSILIVFIDYGNSESKAINDIYPLEESLTRLPAMAVACTLADVGFVLLWSSSRFHSHRFLFSHFQTIKTSGRLKKRKFLID